MSRRNLLLYYAWSRPGETGAPLPTIEDRFPALFESRRMLYPRLEELSDPTLFNQGIGGFLDHILRQNFVAFTERAALSTGRPVTPIEREAEDGTPTPLSDALLDAVDTLIVISFDSVRTGQQAGAEEVAAVGRFLSNPDHLAFVCPHHDIGDAPELGHDARLERQLAEFLHHGDRTIPPQQRFGGYARSLLAGLGVPVRNRFGLHPASTAEGEPAPIEAERALDRLGLLDGVDSFNLHPHLPHMERLGEAARRMDVLARQRIDPHALPHPFTQGGRTTFDALLQSAPDAFAGTLLVGDATIWSSLAGGADSLERMWRNVLERPARA